MEIKKDNRNFILGLCSILCTNISIISAILLFSIRHALELFNLTYLIDLGFELLLVAGIIIGIIGLCIKGEKNHKNRIGKILSIISIGIVVLFISTGILLMMIAVSTWHM